jgi:hypothetical protein
VTRADTNHGRPRDGKPIIDEPHRDLVAHADEGFDVAATTFLSLNSIKSYIRTTYRKIGVTSRTQAVLWGFEHGVKPDHHRIDPWRGGP